MIYPDQLMAGRLVQIPYLELRLTQFDYWNSNIHAVICKSKCFQLTFKWIRPCLSIQRRNSHPYMNEMLYNVCLFLEMNFCPDVVVGLKYGGKVISRSWCLSSVLQTKLGDQLPMLILHNAAVSHYTTVSTLLHLVLRRPTAAKGV